MVLRKAQSAVTIHRKKGVLLTIRLSLIAFVNDLRLVANFWLRSGDTAASSNFLSFLENTLEKLENRKVSLIRLDSGFCSDDIMRY